MLCSNFQDYKTCSFINNGLPLFFTRPATPGLEQVIGLYFTGDACDKTILRWKLYITAGVRSAKTRRFLIAYFISSYV